MLQIKKILGEDLNDMILETASDAIDFENKREIMDGSAIDTALGRLAELKSEAHVDRKIC
jgi:hypothetical protein